MSVASGAPSLKASREEALTLRDILRIIGRLDVAGRTQMFAQIMKDQREVRRDGLHLRRIEGPVDREVTVVDSAGTRRTMLMFGSNNYLGLCNHPYLRERVTEIMGRDGTGLSGPPLLGGYTILTRQLEERIAAYEGQEDAMIFASGYAANVGLMSALPNRRDLVVHDVDSHASFYDGIRMADIPARSFAHNDVEDLEAVLSAHRHEGKDVFVCVEGVYSMNGTLAPLDQIAASCQRHDAMLILDDAHGTGISGPRGTGTATRFGVEDQVGAVLGTFSKALAVNGGFVAASQPIVEYLRYFARSYVFSASPPPTTVAAVLAGFDLLEREPERHERLMAHCRTVAEGLRALGHAADERTPIFPIPVPLGMDIRAAAHDFHDRGVFINHIEFPAVKTTEQRFRISVSAAHTSEDLDRLLTAVEEVWHRHGPRGDSFASEPVMLD